MSKINSIQLYTMQVYGEYGTPRIIHGIVIYRDGNSVFMLEGGESLEGMEVETLEERFIFYNRSSQVDTTDLGEKIIDVMSMAFDLSEVTPVYTKYQIYQCYGGPEEGGWYYDNYHPVMTLDSMPDWETVNNDEAHVYHKEFYYGQNSKTDREFYQ